MNVEKIAKEILAADTFSSANLSSALKKLTSMSESDMTKALGHFHGEGYTNEAQRNLKYKESPRFKGKLQFTKMPLGIQAVYSMAAYDKSVEDPSDALTTNVYVTWDGKDFSTQF